MKSYLALAGGVTEVTRQRAVAAAKALVAQGEATAEQVTSLAEDLLSQSRQNREAVVALVGYEVDRALARVGLATADEVAALTERVQALESRLAGSGSAAPAASGQQKPKAAAKKAPATKAAASKAPAKKAKAPAQKASAGTPRDKS